MKYRLDDNNLRIIRKASEITCTNYEIDNQDYIEIENLLDAIECLEYEVDRLNEKYEDLKQDIEDNYKRIPISEQVG